jgi:rhodanese-related sulfurtransferase
LICDAGREEEAITRLARVGFDNVIGYLDGGFEAWKKAGFEIDKVEQVTAEELAQIHKNSEVHIVDVRKKSEYDSEHLVEAINAPLDYINDSMKLLSPDTKYYVHCAGGYRSMAFISILKSRGYEHLVDVKGGFKAIKETGKFRMTDYVCPTTEL